MYEDHRYKRSTENSSSCLTAIVKVVRPIFRVGRDFCKETSIHGFNHIASPRRHWFERILWVGVLAAAVWGAVDVSLGQLQRYNENPTVVTLEKDFRTWHFDYPAISFCYKDRVNPTKLPDAINKYWNTTPSDDKYSYYKKFVETVANSDLFHLDGYFEFKDHDSLNVDFKQLVVDVMPALEMKSIYSENVEPVWIPAMTEAGVCFVANSLALADVALIEIDVNETQNYPLTCDYASLVCFIMVEVSRSVDYYLHSPYDVMDLAMLVTRITPPQSRVTELSLMEMRSGKGVRELAPKRRECLYTDEPTKAHRRVYTTNTCRLSCRSWLTVKLCGCKPFYYFYEEGPTCTVSGMQCLAAFANVLPNIGGEKCACSQACVDSVFKEISVEDQFWDKGPFKDRGAIRYTIQAPRTRYTREIVFHFQDLVVSFGGAAGLFLGASFISFVEIFYFVLVRVLKLCIGEPAKADAVSELPRHHVKAVPYEEERIRELNRIIDDQKRFNSFKLYNLQRRK